MLAQVKILLSGTSIPGGVSPYVCREIVEGDNDDIIEFMIGYNTVRCLPLAISHRSVWSQTPSSHFCCVCVVIFVYVLCCVL